MPSSSDIELSPPRRRPLRGQQSIAEIIEHGLTDRTQSKKAVKQLEFGRGSPMHRYHQELWVDRLNAFREHTLRKDISQPFTGEELFRFIASIIPKVRSKAQKSADNSTRPVPNLATFHNGIAILIDYGVFTWPGFTFEKHWRTRLQTLFDNMVQQSALTKGRSMERAWIGFATLSRLVRAYLENAIQHGTTSWDQVMMRVLSVVLVAALGARGGDIARSDLYTGSEYLKYEDITLTVETESQTGTETDTIIHGEICVKYAKGHKLEKNDNQLFFVSTLAKDWHVCPISLLLTHALRHGLVQGKTIQEVIQVARSHSQRTVVWMEPKLPVLASFGKGKCYQLDLTKPAGVPQLRQSVKLMAIASGITGRAYIHATRLGFARDFSHLKRVGVDGSASDNLRQAMGHAKVHMAERYSGGMTSEIWNERADQQPIHRREPLFTLDQNALITKRKRPVTDADREEYQSAHPDEDLSRTTLNARIRNERLRTLDVPLEPRQIKKRAAEEKPEEKAEIVAPPTTESRLLRSDRFKRIVQPLHPFAMNHTTLAHDDEQSATNESHDGSFAAPTVFDPDEDNSANRDDVIDPALLADDGFLGKVDSYVSNRAAEELLHVICDRETEDSIVDQTYNNGDESDVGSSTIASQALLALPPSLHEDQRTVTANDWITGFAQCNVVNNLNFARLLSQNPDNLTAALEQAEVCRMIVRGHARNEPTPFLFRCQKCRSFTSIWQSGLRIHENSCNGQDQTEVLQQNPIFHCPEDNCGFSTLSKKGLSTHRQVHTYKPMACQKGCDDPDTIYQTKAQYNQHCKAVHSVWPVRCAHPDCDGNDETYSEHRYTAHLKSKHSVEGDAKRQYWPAFYSKPAFVKGQSCSIDACETKLDDMWALKLHLRKVHRMDEAQAERWATEHAQTERRLRDNSKPRASKTASIKQLRGNHGMDV